MRSFMMRPWCAALNASDVSLAASAGPCLWFVVVRVPCVVATDFCEGDDGDKGNERNEGNKAARGRLAATRSVTVSHDRSRDM